MLWSLVHVCNGPPYVMVPCVLLSPGRGDEWTYEDQVSLIRWSRVSLTCQQALKCATSDRV